MSSFINDNTKVQFGDNKEDVVNSDSDLEDESDNDEDEDVDDEEDEEEADWDDSKEEAESEDEVENDDDAKNGGKKRKRKAAAAVPTPQSEMVESARKKAKKTSSAKNPSDQLEGKKKKSSTVADINQRLLEEMGDFDDQADSDLDDDDDDQDNDQLDSVNVDPTEEKLKENSEKGGKKPKQVAGLIDGKFHHRLATSKDTENHSRVQEALAKISSSAKVQASSVKSNDDDDSDKSDDDEDEDDDIMDDDDDTEEEQSDADGAKSDSDKEESDGDEEETSDLRWKSDLATKAREAFYSRQSGTTSLRKLVYGQQEEQPKSDVKDDQEDEDEIGGLFRVARQHQGRAEKSEATEAMDGVDCSLFRVTGLLDWNLEEVKERIKDCFVTGKWEAGKDAEELLKLDDEDDEMFGDFEDLETGQKMSGKKQKSTDSGDDDADVDKDGGDDDEEEKPRVVNYGGEVEEEKAKRKARMERKLQLKRQFDTDYDDGEGGKASTFYDDLKKEVDEQANLNRKEFEDMDDSQRVLYEGFRPGMYVRIEIKGAPCELIEHFDPTTPLILGALLKGEDQIGYVQEYRRCLDI